MVALTSNVLGNSIGKLKLGLLLIGHLVVLASATEPVLSHNSHQTFNSQT